MAVDDELELDEGAELSLLETLDHVLDRGLVIAGEVRIAVADVDLVFLGLNVLLGSVETVERVLGERERRIDFLSGGAFEGLAGVCGSRVRVLALGSLAAVVSEPGDEAVAVNEENLLAHNRVNAAALAVATPLPCRFGTRAAPGRLEGYVSANGAALSSALARVRGRVEMSVKLMGKSEGRKTEVESEEGGALRAVAGGADLGPAGAGTAFLFKKRRELLGEEGARRRAAEAAAWLAGGPPRTARETAQR